MVNDACPISSKPLAAGCPTTTWDGVTLGFCCNGCKTRFEGQSAEAKTAEEFDAQITKALKTKGPYLIACQL